MIWFNFEIIFYFTSKDQGYFLICGLGFFIFYSFSFNISHYVWKAVTVLNMGYAL